MHRGLRCLLTYDLNHMRGCRNQQSLVEGLSHRSKDSVNPLAERAPKAAYASAAGYHAFNPQNDQHLLQVSGSYHTIVHG